MSGPADNTGRCPVCGLAPQVRGCTPRACGLSVDPEVLAEIAARGGITLTEWIDDGDGERGGLYFRLPQGVLNPGSNNGAYHWWEPDEAKHNVRVWVDGMLGQLAHVEAPFEEWSPAKRVYMSLLFLQMNLGRCPRKLTSVPVRSDSY